MATLALTEVLENVLHEILDAARAGKYTLTEDQTQAINDDIARRSVRISNIQLITEFSEKKNPNFSLYQLISGTKLLFPKFEKPVRVEESEETKSRRNYLQLKQQERNYNQMVYGTESNPEIENNRTTGANSFSSMKNQMTISANMIVSIFIMFGIGYMIGKTVTEDETKRMICGLIASILIMIVEMTLFIVRAVQMENAYENKKPDPFLSPRAGAAPYTAKLAAQAADAAYSIEHDVSIPSGGLPLIGDEDDDEEGEGGWTKSELFTKTKLE